MMPTLTISLSLNATMADGQRHQTVALPLIWVTMPLKGWRRLRQRLQTAATLISIGCQSLAWGLAG